MILPELLPVLAIHLYALGTAAVVAGILARNEWLKRAALPHSVTKPASGPDQPGIFHTLLLQDEQDKELAATISFPNQRYEFQHQCVHLFPFSATNIQYPNRFPEHAESPLPGHAPIHASNAERGTP